MRLNWSRIILQLKISYREYNGYDDNVGSGSLRALWALCESVPWTLQLALKFPNPTNGI